MTRSHARLSRIAARAATTALFVLVCCSAPAPAQAQFGSIPSPFSKLTGGYLWGSLGFRDVEHPERIYLGDGHPFVRGGFAALLGPFGGQPDTIVSLDSVRTTVEWAQATKSTPGVVRVDTMRTVHAVRSRHTLPGRDGWVSLAVGYQHSGAYRVDVRGDRGTLTSTFPASGLYVSAMFGPFRVWRAPRSTFWYVALGASVSQLAQANGNSDRTLVRFDTERALAPEAALMLGWRVHRGVRVITGVSVQHIRWSSIRYRAPSEAPLSDDELRRLPDELRLTSVHVNLGVSFDAGDLFGK